MAAMQSSATTMWTTTTEFFAADAAAAGNQAAVQNIEAIAADAGVTATPLAEGYGVGQTATPLAEGAAVGGEAIVEGVAAPMSTPSVSFNTAVAPKPTGMMAWLKGNPMATMMLGQAGAGAYGGYLQDKAEQREDEFRKSRGLMGFDSTGTYGGGVVKSRMPNADDVAPSATTAPTVAAPVVASQQTVQVPRSDLVELNKQGQLLKG